MNPWNLVVAASASRSLDRLAEGVAAAIVEFMLGPLCEKPPVAGTPLRRELTGYWPARRGAYRIVYRLDYERHDVLVVRIQHRSDVYLPR
ncbi:MAG: type II toxin-antitoxin system RelE/ParE family toxin [Microthrixaceae bacterium]|nr:type II toxin-antitoxin system RelE/ParE family toxin [Microthrixaceae bacterium]